MINKRRLFFLLLWVGLSCSLSAQLDTATIYKKVRHVPKKMQKDPVVLAEHFASLFSDDASRVAAIAYWLIENIEYDFRGYQNRRVERFEPPEVLIRKKALDGEFAELFVVMCNAIGIPAESIFGYTRDFDFLPNDKFYRAGRTWNMVKIDGQWKLMDLSAASGTITHREQRFAKMLYLRFDIPYSQKTKYVRGYHAEWLYVPPSKMIETHLPAIENFQFLDRYVPIDSFAKGEMAIQNFLRQNNVKENQGTLLNLYLSKTQTEKWLYVAQDGHHYNKSNNRIVGFSNYMVAGTIVKEKYDPTSKTLSISDDSVYLLKRYIAVADSMLALSKIDNKEEFKTYAERSNGWKNDKRLKNKEFNTMLSGRVKQNKKEISLSAKIEKEKKTISGFASGVKGQADLKAIDEVARGTSTEPDDILMAKRYLFMADSATQVARAKITMKDSLMNVFPKEKQLKVVEDEKQALLTYLTNQMALKYFVTEQKISLPQVYTTNAPIEKEWFQGTQYTADSIHVNGTDTLLKALYTNQKMGFALMKDYFKTAKTAAGYYKKAKKLSNVDQKEDEQYKACVNAIEQNFKIYQNQLKSYYVVSNDLTKILNKEIKVLTKTNALFKEDNAYESLRNKQYIVYRKSINRGEDKALKHTTKQLNKIRKYVNKTEQVLISEGKGKVIIKEVPKYKIYIE